MQNVKKLIHEAEVKKRMRGMRDPAKEKSPVER
jgi:hypothetical protein